MGKNRMELKTVMLKIVEIGYFQMHSYDVILTQSIEKVKWLTARNAYRLDII